MIVSQKMRGVEMTTVTALFGDGHWLIDTEGRVTATGDAALVYPTRTIECAPGPNTPFGADAAGWLRLTLRCASAPFDLG